MTLLTERNQITVRVGPTAPKWYDVVYRRVVLHASSATLARVVVTFEDGFTHLLPLFIFWVVSHANIPQEVTVLFFMYHVTCYHYTRVVFGTDLSVPDIVLVIVMGRDDLDVPPLVDVGVPDTDFLTHLPLIIYLPLTYT